jgi:hypothetical protein
MAAVERWSPAHPDFVLDEPPPIGCTKGAIDERITYRSSGSLRRIEA